MWKLHIFDPEEMRRPPFLSNSYEKMFYWYGKVFQQFEFGKSSSLDRSLDIDTNLLRGKSLISLFEWIF